MKHSMIAVAVLAVLLAGAGTVPAATMTLTHNTPTGTLPFTDGFTLAGAYDTGAGYVPAWGTLVQVQLSLTTTATAQVDVLNTLLTSEPFTNATAVIPVTLTGPSGLYVTANTTAGPFNDIAAPGPNSFSGIPGTASNSLTDPNLAYYAVATPVALTASGTGGTYGGSGPFGMYFSGSADAGGDFSVTYTYAVPEPGTVVLLGMAALGGLAYGWRRRRS